MSHLVIDSSNAGYSVTKFSSNEAVKFHKSCKNKFSNLKMVRVEKQRKMSFEKRSY